MSSLHQRYEVTHDGDVICINEYATQIAQSSATHVIQINDIQDSEGVNLTSSHINS